MNSLNSTFSPPLSPPIPVFAQFVKSTGALTVKFNQTLRPGLSAPWNWQARVNFPPVLFADQPAPATIAGRTVSTTLVPGAPALNPGVVHYYATPPDVVNDYAVPAAPFANFPLQVIP